MLNKKHSYTSPEVQNKLLALMANDVLNSIVAKIKDAPFYSILVDETTDCSNKEQMVLCLRYILYNFLILSTLF